MIMAFFWLPSFVFCFIFQVKSPKQEKGIKKHILHACEVMKAKNVTQFHDTDYLHEAKWVISEQFKLIACRVRKVGSTNIARVLYFLDHMSEYNDSNQIHKGVVRKKAKLRNLKPFPTEESFQTHFKSYKTFIFVRDPLERLLSAYRDHLPGVLFESNNMTFKDFLEKVLAIPDMIINNHVASFTRLCNPCRMEYDFIGFMDRYNDDLRKILKSVDADKYVDIPYRNQTGYMKSKSSETFQTYLKDLPKSLVKKIYEKYYWDYFLFDFTKPDF